MKTFDNVFDNPKEKLKLDLINLESYLMESLRRKILLEGKPSAFLNEKAITVNLNNYVELTYIDNRLKFIDADGQYHSLFYDNNLEELIDLL